MATEAKRRRVEGSSLSKVLPSLDLTSTSPYVLLDCQILLKKVLISRELVEQFLIHQRHFQQLLNLVCSCSERQALSDDDKTTWQSVTKECLSVLANCCHFSIAACQEIKKSANGVIQHIGKMLVDTQQSDLVKSTALRLLGNMCEHKETAVPIVQTPALLDTICAACQQVSPDVRRNAIRSIRLLVSLSNSFAKSVIASDGAYFLGKIVSGQSSDADLQASLVILLRLLKVSPEEVGRQLARSECAFTLITSVLQTSTEPNSKIAIDRRQLTVELCQASLEMREAFAAVGAINMICQCDNFDPPDLPCRLLSPFAQDAFSRAALRESGALDKLVLRFRDCKDVDERARLVATFKYFIYDKVGMMHLSRNESYVLTLIAHMSDYTTHFGAFCSAQNGGDAMEQEDDEYRPDSPVLMEIQRQRQAKQSSEQLLASKSAPQLCKDFMAERCSQNLIYWTATPGSPNASCTSSASSSPGRAWSACMSPVGSSFGSPVGWASPVGSDGCGDQLSLSHVNTDGGMSPACLDDQADVLEDQEQLSADANTAAPRTSKSDEGGSSEERLQKELVRGEIFLLSWMSHNEATLARLTRFEVVDKLLEYMALVSELDDRAARILKRLAQSRESVEALLAIEFHYRVLFHLCRTTCRLMRHADRCSRCERRAHFGRDLLAGFSSHVDSDFGVGLLARDLTRFDSDEEAGIRAAIAVPFLVKSTYRRTRLLKDYQAFDRLLRTLRRLLTGSLVENSEQLACKIVSSLAALVPVDQLQSILQSNNSHSWGEQCMLVDDNAIAEDADGQFLFFCFPSGRTVRVSKSRFCTSNVYFGSMFDSSFVEQSTSQTQFQFRPDIEQCTEEDFTKFLHFLSGCHSACTTVDSAQLCLSLLMLGDRYLCPELTAHLLHINGPLRYLICGSNLPEFLTTALSIEENEALLHICFATLFKHCSDSEIVRVLSVVKSHTVFLDSFFAHLNRFLRQFVRL